MAALEGLDSEAIIAVLLTAATDALDDDALREPWLSSWTAVLEGTTYDLVGRIFAALADLLAGQPATTSALPDEPRRLWHQLAGTDTPDT